MRGPSQPLSHCNASTRPRRCRHRRAPLPAPRAAAHRGTATSTPPFSTSRAADSARPAMAPSSRSATAERSTPICSASDANAAPAPAGCGAVAAAGWLGGEGDGAAKTAAPPRRARCCCGRRGRGECAALPAGRCAGACVCLVRANGGLVTLAECSISLGWVLCCRAVGALLHVGGSSQPSTTTSLWAMWKGLSRCLRLLSYKTCPHLQVIRIMPLPLHTRSAAALLLHSLNQ